KRHVERRALGRAPRPLQCLGLGMRPTAGLRPATTQDHTVLDDNRADRRVGPGAAEPAPTERKRKLHETPILGRIGGRRCRRWGRGGHFRALAGLASSSLASSARASSKSLGSRKFRYTEAKRT